MRPRSRATRGGGRAPCGYAGCRRIPPAGVELPRLSLGLPVGEEKVVAACPFVSRGGQRGLARLANEEGAGMGGAPSGLEILTRAPRGSAAASTESTTLTSSARPLSL